MGNIMNLVQELFMAPFNVSGVLMGEGGIQKLFMLPLDLVGASGQALTNAFGVIRDQLIR